MVDETGPTLLLPLRELSPSPWGSFWGCSVEPRSASGRNSEKLSGVAPVVTSGHTASLSPGVSLTSPSVSFASSHEIRHISVAVVEGTAVGQNDILLVHVALGGCPFDNDVVAWDLAAFSHTRRTAICCGLSPSPILDNWQSGTIALTGACSSLLLPAASLRFFARL